MQPLTLDRQRALRARDVGRRAKVGREVEPDRPVVPLAVTEVDRARGLRGDRVGAAAHMLASEVVRHDSRLLWPPVDSVLAIACTRYSASAQMLASVNQGKSS